MGRLDLELWGPGVAVGLVVLAIAQMGVHLVFFLHITSGPDNANNVLALAFGVRIVFLVMIGTIWIMSHLVANMAPRSGDDEPASSALIFLTICLRFGIHGKTGSADSGGCIA